MWPCCSTVWFLELGISMPFSVTCAASVIDLRKSWRLCYSLEVWKGFLSAPWEYSAPRNQSPGRRKCSEERGQVGAVTGPHWEPVVTSFCRDYTTINLMNRLHFSVCPLSLIYLQAHFWYSRQIWFSALFSCYGTHMWGASLSISLSFYLVLCLLFLWLSRTLLS